MSTAFSNPVFFMLWLIGLLILSMPIIVAGVNTIISGYFKAKEQHISKLAGAVGQAFEKTIMKTLEKKQQENKVEEDGNTKWDS